MRNLIVSVLLVLAGVSHSSVASPLSPEWRTLPLEGDRTLEYAVLLPGGFDASRSYPLLLALPSGPQTRRSVEADMANWWGEQARSRGWVVVSPVAPEEGLFFRGGERHIGALLRRIRIDFRIEGNRMHLAGCSNGGRSGFRVALDHPHEFRSLTVLPGYPPTDEDFARLDRLRGMRVQLFVGSEDEGWVPRAERTVARLRELGIPVGLEILAGEGHMPPSLGGDRILKLLDTFQQPGRPDGSVESDVALALDDFHDAASKGDGPRYFGRFAPEGVFLGTDGSERWTVEEFRGWGGRYFERESAWIYVPRERNVFLDPSKTVAWFDEVVENASYGACRGTGALRRVGSEWKLTQYNLMIPVPNELVSTLLAWERNGPPTQGPPTTIYLVRHAEKQSIPGERDPSLTEAGRARADALARALRSVPLSAIYTSQFKRTQETAAPAGKAHECQPVVRDARDVSGLVEEVLSEHAGGNVLIVGHSNTVPALIGAFGVEERVKIDDKSGYDGLFRVEVRGDEVRLVRLHYGE